MIVSTLCGKISTLHPSRSSSSFSVRTRRPVGRYQGKLAELPSVCV